MQQRGDSMSLEEVISNLVNWLVIPFVGFVAYLHTRLNRVEINMERLLTQIDERQKFSVEERRDQQRERDQSRAEHLEVNRELRDALNKLNMRLDAMVARSNNGGPQG
jgi:hypothetical protein